MLRWGFSVLKSLTEELGRYHLKIVIESIPHGSQRYETVGDWEREKDGMVKIRVSETGNEDYTLLVALHELVEWWLCERRGITDEKVTGFDVAFESRRGQGNRDEPGDDPKAPYRNEHCIATGVERLLAGILGISWGLYEEALLNL